MAMKRAKEIMIARSGVPPPHRFQTERAGRAKRSHRIRPEGSGWRTRSGASPRWSSTFRSRGWSEAASPPASPSTAIRTPSEMTRRAERPESGRRSTASSGDSSTSWWSTRDAGTSSTTSRTGSGRISASYVPAALRRATFAGGYPLQYLVYLVALHRHLGTRLPGYDYERHMGGVFYLYLRGIDPLAGMSRGVYFDRPARACIQALDDCFRGAAPVVG